MSNAEQRGHTLVEASIVTILVGLASTVIYGAITSTEQADGYIRATYNVPHYPYILLIDSKGVIRYIYDNRGPKSLDAAIEKLMAEMDSNKVSQR